MALISGVQPLSAGWDCRCGWPHPGYAELEAPSSKLSHGATSAALPSLACSFKVKFTVFILIFITFSYLDVWGYAHMSSGVQRGIGFSEAGVLGR